VNMERRFSMNDFEQSLKEQADEFKMMPSKKVWHSIYNNLHPGRRWPSIAISLLLVVTLIGVGYMNTNTGVPTTRSQVTVGHSPAKLNNLPGTMEAGGKQEAGQQNNPFHIYYFDTLAGQAAKTGFTKSTLVGGAGSSDVSLNNSSASRNKLTIQNLNLRLDLININSREAGENDVAKINALKNYSELQKDEFQGNFTNDQVRAFQDDAIKNRINEIRSGGENLMVSNSIYYLQVNDNSRGDKLADHDLLNRSNDKKELSEKGSISINKKQAKLHRKKNENISWIYFAAPELNSVLFRGKPIQPSINPNLSLSLSVAVNQKNVRVLYNSTAGFEAGAQMNYKIARKLEFTTALQLNYSGYNVVSNEIHPTVSNLILKDPQTGFNFTKSYITHYGDGTGQTVVLIRNYSLQTSLPVGLQYEFLHINKLQFNAAANFAPTFVLKSNAYILSSDGNYIKDNTLLRNWNMTSNFGIFVTLHSQKYKWVIGPDLRYQWLSTYKKEYSMQEHLINYGLRIGISR
jgi:hypothetical protein